MNRNLLLFTMKMRISDHICLRYWLYTHFFVVECVKEWNNWLELNWKQQQQQKISSRYTYQLMPSYGAGAKLCCLVLVLVQWELNYNLNIARIERKKDCKKEKESLSQRVSEFIFEEKLNVKNHKQIHAGMNK